MVCGGWATAMENMKIGVNVPVGGNALRGAHGFKTWDEAHAFWHEKYPRRWIFTAAFWQEQGGPGVGAQQEAVQGSRGVVVENCCLKVKKANGSQNVDSRD